MKNKTIISCMLVLAILPLTPSILAVQQKTIGESTSVDFPDLIVENIYFYSRNPEWDYWELYIKIQNIGEGIAYEPITVKLVILRSLLGILPIIPVRVGTKDILTGILPGETKTRRIASGNALPRLSGYYRVLAFINVDKELNESNYWNNWRSERRIKLGPYW